MSAAARVSGAPRSAANGRDLRYLGIDPSAYVFAASARDETSGRANSARSPRSMPGRSIWFSATTCCTTLQRPRSSRRACARSRSGCAALRISDCSRRRTTSRAISTATSSVPPSFYREAFTRARAARGGNALLDPRGARERSRGAGAHRRLSRTPHGASIRTGSGAAGKSSWARIPYRLTRSQRPRSAPICATRSWMR